MVAEKRPIAVDAVEQVECRARSWGVDLICTTMKSKQVPPVLYNTAIAVGFSGARRALDSRPRLWSSPVFAPSSSSCRNVRHVRSGNKPASQPGLHFQVVCGGLISSMQF